MTPKTIVRAAGALSCFFLWSCLVAQQPNGQHSTTVVKPKATDWTLADFRRSYLNQRILILKGNDAGRGSLGGWQPVVLAKNGSFKDDYSKGAFIDFKYKEQTPKIIAIQESSGGGMLVPKEGQTNALGETLNADAIVNPSVEVFAQFDDGQIAKYTSIVSLIRDRSVENFRQDPDFWDMEFMLASDRDSHAEIIQRNLPSSIGKKLYAVHDSLLFGPDITPTELLDLGSRLTKQVRDVPLLTPMTIVAAKYNERYDFIVWKLRLDNGREVISASRYRDEDVSSNGNDNSFLGRSTSTLLLNVPSNLTPREITAISSGKIFRGMSRQAVYYSWGVTRENDYGTGGKQLVYGDNQFVYIDGSGTVTNWQSLDR
jgi:hypothetical protein